jgi:hypothetical protein
MRLLLLSAGILGAATLAQPAEAQSCGAPCKRCAAQLGIALDASGIPMRTGGRGNAGASRAWQACLERERGVERSGAQGTKRR